MACEKDGRLQLHEPVSPKVQNWREIWCTRRLLSQMAPGQSDEIEMRMGLLAADFDFFTNNGVLQLGKGSNGGGFLKLLQPAREAVWEIRSQSPKPGIRVFGRFAEQDTFIATNLAFRKELGNANSDAFREAIETCKREWRNCFGELEPLRGRNVSDYIRENGMGDGDFG